ncbi:MAG: alanine racemase [Thermodesulfovibrionales bacterium]
MNRGTVAEIDLAALRHNLAILRSIAGPRRIIAVVKDDAYGHGASVIARELRSAGVECFAVAYSEEAADLRKSGLDGEIIVLFDRSFPEECFSGTLTPVLHDLPTAERLSAAAVKRKARISVHVKVDTGMGRMGLPPATAEEDLTRIAGLPGIGIAGLMSHFAGADLEDRSSAELQTARFRSICDGFSARTGLTPLRHIANSAAALTLPDSLFDAVRPGLLLYGVSPVRNDFGLRPVMKVRSHVLTIRSVPRGVPVSYSGTFVTSRDSRIAVLPCGYADGYVRHFSNKAAVLIRGRRAPVVGRVCMDLTLADVTDIPAAEEGDEAVLLGAQGAEQIQARELAGYASTISYEILTGLGGRARREYRGALAE